MHRVVSPTQGTRYSVGFFQGVAMETRVADAKFECTYFDFRIEEKYGSHSVISPEGAS
jgi:isopenicillin N synthase-like dioxygenase